MLDLLKKESEGNVYFLVEAVRTLAEEAGSLGKIGRMTLPESILAGGIGQIIQRRLAHVPETGRPLLQLAAVAGRELDLTVMKTFVSESGLDDWLTLCANAAILQVQEGQWQFAHDKLRQAVLEAIELEAGSQMHRRVAEAIEAFYGSAPERAGVLAQHWCQAGDKRKEFDCARRAGEHALLMSNFGEAVADLRRAQELLPAQRPMDPIAEADLCSHLGEALHITGQHEDAVSTLEMALALYRDHPQGIARINNLLATIEASQGKFAEALAHFQTSPTLYRALDDQEGLADTLNKMGTLHAQQGQLTAAQVFYEEGLTYARRCQNQRTIARILNNLGIIASSHKNYDQAVRYYEEALELARVLGHRQVIANILNNLGNRALERGDFPSAWPYFEESLEYNRTNGNKWSIADTLTNMGHLARMEGRLNARDYYLEALRLALDIGSTPVMTEILVSLAALDTDSEHALAWVGLALNHPAANQFTRKEAAPLLEKWNGTLSPQKVTAALERGKSLDLDTVARAILGQNRHYPK